MSGLDERIFRLLLRLYPREFRRDYQDDLLAFFRQDRRHPKYGSGPLRLVRFWSATIRGPAFALSSLGAQASKPQRRKAASSV